MAKIIIHVIKKGLMDGKCHEESDKIASVYVGRLCKHSLQFPFGRGYPATLHSFVLCPPFLTGELRSSLQFEVSYPKIKTFTVLFCTYIAIIRKQSADDKYFFSPRNLMRIRFRRLQRRLASPIQCSIEMASTLTQI